MELTAEKITRQYFRNSSESNVFSAVKEASLIVRSGEIAVVTGRSGSGKSTLLNMLAGLLKPTCGRVLAGGVDLYSLDDAERSRFRNRNIGVIPQGQTGLNSLTVLENIMLPYRLYGDACKADDAEKMLESVGLFGLGGVYPNELSGGEMRRLAIARALLRRPEILLADEPTGDLDDENTKTVLELLRKAADSGAAVLLVTHENEAEAYADTVYRMSSGVLTLEKAQTAKSDHFLKNIDPA